MITFDEADIALQSKSYVEYNNPIHNIVSRNYIISGIIKRANAGQIYYQLELTEIYDRKAENITNNRAKRIIITDMNGVNL